jgi:MarR family transcriptional regulator, temperature-dependent positive regulator of motility
MNTHPRTPPEAWRLQVLKLLQANPSLSQRQLAAEMGVSLGKANYCLRALVEKGLVKLGNFSKNPNKGKYAYILTPAGLEEKTRITLAFLKRKEAEFEAIRSEIETLKGVISGCLILDWAAQPRSASPRNAMAQPPNARRHSGPRLP